MWKIKYMIMILSTLSPIKHIYILPTCFAKILFSGGNMIVGVDGCCTELRRIEI